MATTKRAASKDTFVITETVVKKLRAGTVFLTLTVHRPGTQRVIDADEFDVDADKNAIRVSKKILRSPELREISMEDRRVRRRIRRLALPSSLHKSVYMLAAASIPKALTILEEHRERRPQLIKEFGAMYPQRVKEAKAQLRSLWNEADYPDWEALEACFSVESRFLSLEVAPQLQTIDRDAYVQELEQQAQDWARAAGDIRTGLRAKLHSFVDAMIRKLEGAADGEPKRRLPKNMLVKFQEFLALLDEKNVLGDSVLQQMVALSRTATAGVAMDDLREEEAIRGAVTRQLKTMVETLAPLAVVPKKTRTFTLARGKTTPA